jgi:DNA-binding NtrC family response regulator
MTERDSSASALRELIGAEVLVLDRDPAVHKGITSLLSSASLHVTCVATPDAAVRAMDRRFYSVVLVDLDTPRSGAGLTAVETVKRLSPTSMVIVLTPRKSFSDAVAAIRSGAVDIVWKSSEAVSYLKDRVFEAAGRSVGKREVHSILADVRDTYDDFLQRFMDAERRALDASDRAVGRADTEVANEPIRVCVVDADRKLYDALARTAQPGFAFAAALSGGEALDRCGTGDFEMAMVSSALPDLPGSMVVRSIKTQAPEMIVLTYTLEGPVEIVEARRTIPVLAKFTATAQLVDRLDELAQAYRAKNRERRYTQAFRERHYDFLRRYVELKSKIERTLGETDPEPKQPRPRASVV